MLLLYQDVNALLCSGVVCDIKVHFIERAQRWIRTRNLEHERPRVHHWANELIILISHTPEYNNAFAS